MSGVQLFWLAPVLPLLVFALLAVGVVRYGRLASGLAVAGMVGASIVSILGLLDAAQGKRAMLSIPWLAVGGRQLSLGLWLDPLSAFGATLVSVVGLVVFLYAVSYMAEDPRRGRFFAEFSLFTGSMLTLVLAADLITLFIAWELVGLCSYLLIGFWFERPGENGKWANRYRPWRFHTGTHRIWPAAGNRTAHLRRSGRQIRPVPFSRVVAGCHAWSYTRLSAAAFGDDGRGRRLPGGAALSTLPCGWPFFTGRRLDRRDHRTAGRVGGAG